MTVSSGAVTPSINAVLATIPGLSSNTAVTSNANPGSVDTPIIYYATVTPTDNGGTVAFTDNGQPVNTCAAQPVVATVATCTITYPGVGSHEIGAAYTGDEGYASSNSIEFDETIQILRTAAHSFEPDEDHDSSDVECQSIAHRQRDLHRGRQSDGQ